MLEELNNLYDLSKSVDKNTAELQTKTSLQLISMLKEVPGVILGDDVGMGKTYVAISTAIYYLDKYPRRKILIITPNWNLNDKWYKDIRNFIELNLNKDRTRIKESDVISIKKKNDISYVEQLKRANEKGKIILLPINVFASRASKLERAYYLCCWFKYRQLKNRIKIEIASKVNEDVLGLSLSDFGDMGIKYEDIPVEWYTSLDEIYTGKKINNDDKEKFVYEINILRQKAMKKMIGRISLLILDEAHKVKNESTVKRANMVSIIKGKFDKGIFLTATPFELGESELKSILRIFQNANITKAEINKYEEVLEEIFDLMNGYIEKMSMFEESVHNLSIEEAISLENAIQGEDNGKLSYDVFETLKIYKELLNLKIDVESNLKKVIVRNVKKKDIYRKEIIGSMDGGNTKGIPLSKEAYLPFAMIEKSIFEILQKGEQTFISNIKQSFTSSFDAIIASTIMSKDITSIYMLKNMNLKEIKHPKINEVSKKIVDLQREGEKVILFCDRNSTIKSLKETLQKELNKSINKDIEKLFPENGVKGFDNYCKRFYSKTDVSWFLLQENYIHSVLIKIIDICDESVDIIPKPKEIIQEVRKNYKKYNTSNKTNYMYIKRIIEHIAFKTVVDEIADWKKKLRKYTNLKSMAEIITSSEYIQYGISKIDEDIVLDSDMEVKSISLDLVGKIMRYRGIWFIYSEILNRLEPRERETIVQKMIIFLRRDKRFFIKLRKNQLNNKKKEDYSQLVCKTFKSGSFIDWESSYRRYLERYCNETSAGKDELLIGLDNKAEAVAVMNGETDSSSKKRIMAGFNTPFYPQILLLTKTMQEGVDLQKECKTVIHYDMEWNPASMEQRVGRIDRIGSLINNMRSSGETATLDIYYPFIKNTIDENIYNTVKEREKWFNLILGGTPQWETFEIDDESTPIKAWVFKNLQIDLSVE